MSNPNAAIANVLFAGLRKQGYKRIILDFTKESDFDVIPLQENDEIIKTERRQFLEANQKKEIDNNLKITENEL